MVRSVRTKPSAAYSGYSAAHDIRQALVGDNNVGGVRCVLPSRVAELVRQPDKLLGEALKDYVMSVPERDRTKQREENIRETVRNWCDQFVVERTVGQHALLATRDCPLTRLKPQIDRLVGLQQPVSFVEIFLAEGSPRVSADNRPGLISQRWDEIIRQPLIPFDPAARQRRLAHAFESLAPFIHTHEAMKRAGVLD